MAAASLPEDIFEESSALPPSPRLPPFVQSAAWLFRPAPFIEACRRSLGGAFTLRLSGLPPIVVVSNPRAVKDVMTGDPGTFHVGEANIALKPMTWLGSFGARSLFLLDGQRHYDERKLMMAAFHPERLRSYERVMQECVDSAIDGWRVGRSFDLHGEMQGLTLDILLRTIFGAGQVSPDTQLRRAVAKMLSFGEHPSLLFFIGRNGEQQGHELLRRLGRLSPWAGLERSIDEVNAELGVEIAQRRAAGAERREDMLSVLIAARTEQGLSLGDDSLIDEMRTLLVAGHETTARALTFAVFELLRNPQVLGRLERDLALGDEYADAVIRETLRLHPIVPVVARRLMAPARVGDRRYPAGTVIAASIHLTHFDGMTWPEAGRFHPDRFLGSKIGSFEFLPFGHGTRRCLGMAFALLEMRTVLRRVVTRTRLGLARRFGRRPHHRRTTFAVPAGLRVVRRG